MKNSLVNKIKKNISLEDQIISETDYLLENVEYLDDKDFVLESILMNKPAIVLTSRSVWLYVMKKQMKVIQK